MTYIELINHFWRLFENKGMKPNDVLLYFYLLHVSNRKSWQNPFYLPNKTVVIALGISEKSMIDSRRRLIKRGLIQFSKGKRNCSSPGYYIPIIEIKDAEDELLQDFNLLLESRTVDERYMNGSRTVDERYMNEVARIRNHARKTEDLKTKDNISSNEDNSTSPAREPSQLSLFADEEKKTKLESKAKDPLPPSPTYEEVRQYFLTQDADTHLENWEETCQRFYDYFTAVDWRDKFYRRIARWESRANTWILDEEKRQKEKKSHEVKQADRFSERRGTEPTTTSRKGFKGSFQP